MPMAMKRPAEPLVLSTNPFMDLACRGGL